MVYPSVVRSVRDAARAPHSCITHGPVRLPGRNRETRARGTWKTGPRPPPLQHSGSPLTAAPLHARRRAAGRHLRQGAVRAAGARAVERKRTWQHDDRAALAQQRRRHSHVLRALPQHARHMCMSREDGGLGAGKGSAPELTAWGREAEPCRAGARHAAPRRCLPRGTPARSRVAQTPSCSRTPTAGPVARALLRHAKRSTAARCVRASAASTSAAPADAALTCNRMQTA